MAATGTWSECTDVPMTAFNSGTGATSSTYLRGDGTWSTPAGGGVPAGVICMWAGLLANVPSGWALCDGTAGTPDLRDRFIKGWAAGVDPGGTGGAATHGHTTGTYAVSAHSGAAVAAHASHTHTYTDVISHTHTQDAHTHTQNAHSHVLTELRDATTGGSTTNIALTSDTTSTTGTKVTGSTTATNQNATATNQATGIATGTTAGPSATLTHAVTQPDAHTLSGASDTVNHEPVYFKLAFIQKT